MTARVYSKLSAMLRSTRPVFALTLLIVGVAVLVSQTNVVIPSLLMTYLFYLILAVGLQVFVGNSGVFSFGHIGFVAIGAYTSAILITPVETKQMLFREMPPFLLGLQATPILAALIASAAAAAIALVIGIPLMRLNGLSASIATFAFVVIVHTVAINLVPVTNGRSGITGVPPSLSISGLVAWTVVAMAAALAFQNSSVGLRLRATREDEIAARACGIGVLWERVFAWVVSAAICGLGGAVYAQFVHTFSTEAFYLSLTFIVVAMMVVGGTGTVSGAVVGALFVASANELLRVLQKGVSLGPISLPEINGLQQFGVALVTLLILILRPTGLMAGKEIGWPSGLFRRLAALLAGRRPPRP